MIIIQEYIKKNDIKIEILSGLTVALALVPEAVAFSFVAGVKLNGALFAFRLNRLNVG